MQTGLSLRAPPNRNQRLAEAEVGGCAGRDGDKKYPFFIFYFYFFYSALPMITNGVDDNNVV